MSHSDPELRARFDALYRDTRDDVLAYLLRRSDTVEDAADVFAETYAAAWRKIESLPRDDRARLWLFGAARIQLRRSARKALADDHLVAMLANELRPTFDEATAGPELEPDDELWKAIGALPDRDQEILTLTAWESLSPREIAGVMGMPANVIRVRLHRARRQLQSRLALADAALRSGQRSMR